VRGTLERVNVGLFSLGDFTTDTSDVDEKYLPDKVNDDDELRHFVIVIIE
jgi:hypothetical protein